MTTYPMVVLSIKLALLIFYYQLSTWRALRTAVLVTGFISIGNALGGFFAFLFQCTKVNFWDSEFDLTLRCEVHTLKAILGTGIVNIITDALVWVIPMPLVWRLQLYTRERIIAFFTFGLGGMKHTPKLLSYGSSGASDIKSMFKRTGGNNSGSAGTRIRSTAGKTHIHVHSDPQSPESHQSPHGKNMSTASIRIGYVDHEKRDSTGTEVELPIQHPPKAAKMDEFV
ncbi:hypothetical protein TWF191_005400 [Orbilia oligospora]|uniref:Rhodopsin domain-containing protein n=1 Tax=Orbilia oligospora TaxID=2813651 RepID=A0A7C8QST2_ORBOL|nr:hypothetical protein TWF191_005400 [Orbilia oligospora]